MASLKKCVEAKCKDCTYDKAGEGTWRAQTEACTVRACPLWPVRPLTMETIIANRGGNKVVPIDVDVDSILAGLEDDTEEEVA